MKNREKKKEEVMTIENEWPEKSKSIETGIGGGEENQGMERQKDKEKSRGVLFPWCNFWGFYSDFYSSVEGALVRDSWRIRMAVFDPQCVTNTHITWQADNNTL